MWPHPCNKKILVKNLEFFPKKIFHFLWNNILCFTKSEIPFYQGNLLNKNHSIKKSEHENFSHYQLIFCMTHPYTYTPIYISWVVIPSSQGGYIKKHDLSRDNFSHDFFRKSFGIFLRAVTNFFTKLFAQTFHEKSLRALVIKVYESF